MKVTINQIVPKEVDLPLYFKINNRPDSFFMQIGTKSIMQVYDMETDESLLLFPSINFTSVTAMNFDAGITPISEAEFKHVFTKVTNRIESLLN